jgi:hypothetical protein
MKQRRSVAVSYEINFQLPARPDGHHVFQNSGGRSPCGGCSCAPDELQSMPLQMHRYDLVTGVVNLQPVTGPALHAERGLRIGS